MGDPNNLVKELETTQMVKRKAIPHNKDDLPFDVVEIWMSKNGAWEWFVKEKQQDGVLYGLVFSPMCPDGEFGSVYQAELEGIGAIRLELNESLPPSGYRWDE